VLSRRNEMRNEMRFWDVDPMGFPVTCSCCGKPFPDDLDQTALLMTLLRHFTR
jgi:hypothetical protein